MPVIFLSSNYDIIWHRYCIFIIASKPKRKVEIMKPDIVKSLANFLEAIPYQVATWDKKVVDHLFAHPEKLQAFHSGSASTKWRIYSSIKYQPH